MALFKRYNRKNWAPLLFWTPVTHTAQVNYVYTAPADRIDWKVKCKWGYSHIVEFRYGPRPEDWNFWFSEPTDQFAGDFGPLSKTPL